MPDKKSHGGPGRNQGRKRQGEEVKVTTSVTINPALLDKARAAATERDVSLSAFIETALRTLLAVE